MIVFSHLLVISVILTIAIVDCNTGYQFGGNQRGRLIRDSGAITFPDSVPGSYRFNGDKQRSADSTNSISDEVSKLQEANLIVIVIIPLFILSAEIVINFSMNHSDVL